MKSNHRNSLMASPEFIKKLKKLQGKLKAETGIEPSLTDLTKEIVSFTEFEDIENQILKKDISRSGIKFDGILR